MAPVSIMTTPTLLGWLGIDSTATRSKPKTMDARDLSPVRTARPERTVLGVLGTRSNVRYENVEIDILAPILEAWGEPDEVLLPAESDSSHIIQAWAIRRGIPVSLIVSDWSAHGKRAGILRDARIQREATHMLLLQGPRSNALMTLGRRLNRKGRPVVISERPGDPVKSLSTE
jgi:hypothetical protein